MVTNVSFDIEAGGQPVKSQRTVAQKDRSVALLKESIQLGCVSHDTPQRKSILGRNGKLGSNLTVKFSNTTIRRVKIRDKMGPAQGIITKNDEERRRDGV